MAGQNTGAFTMTTEEEGTIQAMLSANMAEIKLELVTAITKLEKSLPCNDNDRRLGAVEKTIQNGKEKEVKDLDVKRDKRNYNLNALRLVFTFCGFLGAVGLWDLMKYFIAKI